MEFEKFVDVMIVYSQNDAMSALSKIDGNVTPFALSVGREHYSESYAYFLTTCQKMGLNAVFTTSKDIIGSGKCKSYWTFSENKWRKINESVSAPIIFDKFNPISKNLLMKRKMLFKSDAVYSFTDPYLFTIFNDKLKTYSELIDFSIPTVNITALTVSRSIDNLQRLVKTHKNKKDFTKDYVLKDRFGAGGIDIYKIDKNPVDAIKNIIATRPHVKFVLQPFMKFDTGYSYKKTKGYTDIRIIFAQEKIVQIYLRTAQENDFRCNEHQGGKVFYVRTNIIPKKVLSLAFEILQKLDKKDALFALDFIVSNNGNPYFLEGNINPGIYWSKSAADKKNTKKLINIIVNELIKRTEDLNAQNDDILSQPIYLPINNTLSSPLMLSKDND